MRDELHNKQPKCKRTCPRDLLKNFSSNLNNDEISASPPGNKVPCVPTRFQHITNYNDVTIDHISISDFMKIQAYPSVLFPVSLIFMKLCAINDQIIAFHCVP